MASILGPLEALPSGGTSREKEGIECADRLAAARVWRGRASRALEAIVSRTWSGSMTKDRWLVCRENEGSTALRAMSLRVAMAVPQT